MVDGTAPDWVGVLAEAIFEAQRVLRHEEGEYASLPDDRKRLLEALARKSAGAALRGEDGFASGVLDTAEALVTAYECRGDMPAAVTALEAALRPHGRCLPWDGGPLDWAELRRTLPPGVVTWSGEEDPVSN